MLINVSMLRLIWTVIEEAPASDLLNLPDTMLVKLLLQQIAQRTLLTGEEVYTLYGYLGSKLSLIRDLAESRLLLEAGLLDTEYVIQQAC